MKVQCVLCHEWKDEEDFNWKCKSLGVRHTSCCECHKPFRKRWYEGRKERHLQQVKERKQLVRDIAREYVWDYLSKHPCIECGESDPVVLEFHHRHGKDPAVSFLVAAGYSIATIQAEIDKCDVLFMTLHICNF